MKGIVQIVLIAGMMLPLCHVAQGETMEERKQRIQRKYLREKQDVTRLDMVVPTLEDDDDIIAAEKRKKNNSSAVLNRQQASQRPAPVPVRPVQQDEPDWWQDYLAAGNDPYADPFAADSGDAANTRREDLWANWLRLQENQNATTTVDPVDNSRIYGGQTPTRGLYDPGAVSTERGSGYSTMSGRGTGVGARTSDQRYNSPGLYESRNDSIYTGTLPTAYGSLEAESQRTPYVAPSSQARQLPSRFNSQTDQNQSPSTTIQPQPSQTTPYDQWQEQKSRSWDPTADDAYVNELMQRNRR